MGRPVPASLGRGQDAEIGQLREALDGLEQRAGESIGGLSRARCTRDSAGVTL